MSSEMISTTKRTIVDTAYIMINENGYRKTTMRAIAKATNLSLGAITHHFKSKFDIIHRLYFTADKNFFREINRIIKANDLDLILGDMVYISVWIKIILADKRQLDYYYDLLCDNCLHKMLLQQVYMQFLRKFNRLNCPINNQEIYACSMIYIGMVSEFVRAIKENQIRLSIEEIVDIFIRQTLFLLRISSEESESILRESNMIYKNISYDASDIFNVKLLDNTRTILT